MSIKKSLLALAAAAMATMAFASPAMATDGVIRDHEGTAAIGNNTEVHMIGWAKFTTGKGSFECHVTAVIKATGATGSTGDVTTFNVPDTTKCTGTGLLNGCKLTSHSSNTSFHATVTSNGKIDITKTGGKVTIINTFSGCLVKNLTTTFSSIELTPLKTGTTSPAPTGTENRLGVTAALNEPIAGFEFEASAVMHVEDIFGGKTEEAVITTGKFEITGAARCTYEISAV